MLIPFSFTIPAESRPLLGPGLLMGSTVDTHRLAEPIRLHGEARLFGPSFAKRPDTRIVDLSGAHYDAELQMYRNMNGPIWAQPYDASNTQTQYETCILSGSFDTYNDSTITQDPIWDCHLENDYDQA